MAVDAQDQLIAFREAIARTLGDRGVVVKAMQAQGRKEHREMHALFMRERYADITGKIKKLGSIRPRWVRRKVALGAVPNRGRFSEGVQRQIKSRKAYIPVEDGFDIDILVPNLTTRVPIRVPGTKKKGSRFRRVRVNDYITFYAQQKAPGLGSISNDAEGRLRQARQRAEEKQYRRLRNIAISAAKGGGERVIQVKMILEEFRA